MEKAIFITKINQLKYVTTKFSRLYYGQEFCERLIPSVNDLKRALLFTRNKGLDFTFVTPYVTNSGLAKLKPLLGMLDRSKRRCEGVINDWGVLNLVTRQYSNIVPVLGRLLTKQKRCPSLIRLLNRHTSIQLIKDPQHPAVKYLLIQNKLPQALDAYYKGSNASSVGVIHDFLISRQIRRIELDNVGQGLCLQLPGNKISASLYLPYVYITTTFFCPTATCDKKDSILKIKPCRRECQRYTFRLRHRTFPKEILLKGNSQFYKNTRLHLKKWLDMRIDRIVYEPEIPI